MFVLVSTQGSFRHTCRSSFACGHSEYPVFRNINLKMPGTVDFGCCLVVAMTKFCNKFASLQQVHSHNPGQPRITFKIKLTCCAPTCIWQFLPNIVVFRMFFMNFADLDVLEIHGSCDHTKYQKPCNKVCTLWHLKLSKAICK